jgi:hypothetical protein
MLNPVSWVGDDENRFGMKLPEESGSWVLTVTAPMAVVGSLLVILL